MKKYDVIVIGAGPGGLEAGRKLAEASKKVLILEKNSIIGNKVCAGGLTGKEIKKIVPPDLLDRTFDQGIICVANKRIKVKVPPGSIATCSRERLGSYMEKRAEDAGVEIKKETEVVSLSQISVICKDGQEFYFDYLIGADGSNSLVRKTLGLKTEKMGPTIQYQVPKIYDDIEVFMDMTKIGPSYIWIFPHDNFTEIGTGAYLKMISFKKVKDYFDDWLEERNIDLSQAKLRSAPINCDYQGFQFGNTFLVGDAAGLTDAFSGEGIYPAIISGREAARKILQPEYHLEEIPKLLAKKYKKERPLQFYEKYKGFSKYGNSLLGLVARSKKVQQKLIRAYLD
ncbi:NAD(P)/FAD-dependent oxidoreductase [Patescibacteria group bacterium]|nr:NAD(P)/FAD-dependent oxidoreductase [Patescibacteria group bacterium]